jgi:L-asparaginase / beta-aspartyl-peptidase
MRQTLLFLFFITAVHCFAQNNSQKKFALAVHGGAGTILKSQMTPEKEKSYQQGLNDALTAGNEILSKGGTAMDAVVAAIKVLEDNPLFNAGKGAVFTNEGKNELDASIMDGKTLKAGAVAGVTTIKNPITAARAVMDKSEHVMMVGKGAEKFAAQQGCTIVDPAYFYTEERWKSFQKTKQTDSLQQSTKDSLKNSNGFSEWFFSPLGVGGKYGTVGCVALDMYGNLAAGTSTGGMTNKKFGRVGDAPIIGAGTYADNNTCAISCTGWGEFFIRLVMAKTISDRMELAHQTLKDAANEMVMKKLGALGGDGGLIAIDKDGNITMPFNTEGMYRAYITSEGKKEIKIYKE